MFGIDAMIWVIIALAAIAAGGVAYVFLFSQFETERKTTNRINRVKAAETDHAVVTAARERMQEAARRRKSMQESLKDLEEKQKNKASRKSLTLKMLLQQSGWKITVLQFYIGSLVLAAVSAFFTLVLSGMPWVAAGVAIVAGLGLPRWIVSFARARRMKAFLNEFPNALDVMVRAIKSGLPLNDSLRLIASEAQEPLRSEFRRIVEAQQLGLSVPEACARLHNNIPLPEANFFGIVIAIQAQAGGNLSDALGNLSRVIRDRRKMRAKVNALSMEAKASAVILGCLPFTIVILVYLTTPSYIMLLFTDPRGHLIIGAGLLWMLIGVFVMRNMINFEI